MKAGKKPIIEEELSEGDKITIKQFLQRIFFRKNTVFISALILFVIGAVWLRQMGLLSPSAIYALIEKNQTLAPILFASIFAVMTILLLPTLPMNLLAGILWGPFLGGIYSLVGVSIGATITFFLSRYLAREFTQQYFHHKSWEWLMNNVNELDWKIIAFTRVNPVFPTGLLNYFYGLTSISYGHYIITTVIFLLPLTVAFSYVGHSIGEFMLNDEVNNVMRNIISLSAVLVVFVVMRVIVKKYVNSETESLI